MLARVRNPGLVSPWGSPPVLSSLPQRHPVKGRQREESVMSTEAQRPSPEGTHSRLRKVWSGPGFGECPRPVTLSRLEGLERSRHAWTPVVLPAPASHKAPVTCYHERHKLRFSASVNHCAPGPTFSCLECGAGPAAPGQVLRGAWGTQSAERPALHLSSGLDLGFLSSSPASGSTLGCSLLNK